MTEKGWKLSRIRIEFVVEAILFFLRYNRSRIQTIKDLAKCYDKSVKNIQEAKAWQKHHY